MVVPSCEGPRARPAALYPGDLIGRSWSAALGIDDPYVSEAHCMVSLRGARLWLLGLRGGLRLEGQRTWVSELELAPGQVVQLGRRAVGRDQSTLRVQEVVHPPHVLALVGIGPRPLPIDRPEWSLFLDPLRAQAGLRPGAAGRLWCTRERWSFQGPDGQVVHVRPGVRVDFGGHRLAFHALPAADLPTAPPTGAAPLRITLRPGSTEIWAAGRPEPALFRGNAHRILLQTAILTRLQQQAVHWREVAAGIWSSDPERLEKNWTKGVGRLRDALEERGLPRDLVRSDAGYVSLGLREGVDELTFLDGAEDWY